MTTFDFSPLFRTSVGFDRLASMLNSAHRPEQVGGYPPYNIESRGENSYRITMAVAGFSEGELNISTELNQLTVNGEQAADDADHGDFLYRGIATRSFERRFNLADHVKVTGAALNNGLLHIELERELPEVMKPKKIAIQSGKTVIDGESRKQVSQEKVSQEKAA